MATKNIVPRADGEGSLGTSAKKWGAIYADSIVLDDEETLAQKISAQNTRITTAEGNVTTLSGTVETLSGDVTTLYGDIEELSDGKLNITDAESTYLKLSGGTLTGAYLQRDSDDSHISVFGGTTWNKGARLILRGKDNTSGQFDLIAHNGTNEGALIGKADGTLTWGGKNVATSGNISSMFTTTYKIQSVSNNGKVYAPEVNGYTFLCWLQPATDGWIGQVYCNKPLGNPTMIWGFSQSGVSMENKSVILSALYVKNS